MVQKNYCNFRFSFIWTFENTTAISESPMWTFKEHQGSRQMYSAYNQKNCQVHSWHSGNVILLHVNNYIIIRSLCIS